MSDEPLACELCRFWRAHNAARGFCIRHAPIKGERHSDDPNTDASWPITRSYDYCGDFEAALRPPD